MDPETVKKLIDYNPESGVFLWKRRGVWVVERGWQSDLARRKFNAKYVGAPCLTSLDKDGYLRGHIMGEHPKGGIFRAHRVAYAVMVGEWPTETVDHVNRIRADNRWENLREASRAEQQRNRGVQANNTSGFSGVHYNKRNARWVARIRRGGKDIFLGSFPNKRSAIAARVDFLLTEGAGGVTC